VRIWGYSAGRLKNFTPQPMSAYAKFLSDFLCVHADFKRYKHLLSAPHKNNAGKKVFVNRSLCSTKTRLQGYINGLKKISTPALRLGSIF
jgi:hypothetical protein